MQPLRGVQTKLECGFRGLGSSFKAQDAGGERQLQKEEGSKTKIQIQ